MKSLILSVGLILLINPILLSQNVWVLNNSDPDFTNPPFNDSLKVFQTDGTLLMAKGDYNITSLTGGSRRLTVTQDGQSCWMGTKDTLYKVDIQGHDIFKILKTVSTIDIAKNGLVYALTYKNSIFGDSIIVIDELGNCVRREAYNGFDIVIDDKNFSVWLVGEDIKRLNLDLQPQFIIDPIGWFASSVDYNSDGTVWVGERGYADIPESQNRLLHIDLNGTILDSVALTDYPMCVRVDRVDGSVWIAASTYLYKYIPDQDTLNIIDEMRCYSLSIDQQNDLVWIGTESDVRSYSKTGELQTVLTYFDGTNQKFVATPTNRSENIKSDLKLTAADGKEGDTFGSSVDIYGNYAAIGSPFDDNENGIDAGAVYIFKYDGSDWIQQQKITAADGASEDIFGYSLSIFGDYLVVGAPWDDDNGIESGSAYIFKQVGNIWTQQDKITASDAGEDNRFGIDVDISGDHVIAGAFFDDDFGTRSGSAYIYKREDANWIEQEILFASDGTNNDWFGVDVSIDGDYAAVGSRYNDNDQGADAGAIYIFKRDGDNWPEQQKLTASDGAESDLFHVNTVNNRWLLAGAYQDDDNGDNSGAVYIFEQNENAWTELTKNTASDGAAGDMFGSSIAISENNFVVGAYRDDDNGDNSGSVYIFEYDGAGWTEKEKIVASDGETGDYFGLSIAIDHRNLLVGARNDDDNGDNAGAAYIYELKALPTNVDFKYVSNQPSDFYLYPAYPNPFNSAATIQYTLPKSMMLTVSIYNMLGQKIKEIENKWQQAGTHTIQWNGNDEQESPVSSGLYFCQIYSNDFNRSIKLILIK